jgi:hypothetical protein
MIAFLYNKKIIIFINYSSLINLKKDKLLGIGDWAQSPIPNPQSPIPNPHSHNFIVI